jgi:hypothetical protein
MKTFKTYISYIIPNGDQNKYDFEIADLNLPKFSFCADNISQEVLKWMEQKQKMLSSHEKLVGINYFNISNLKQNENCTI